MLFYRVGEYFEDRAVDRSRKQIMDAIDLRPETVNLVKDNGKIEVIPAEDAQEGDIVLVRPGDRVPLDGEVVEGESLSLIHISSIFPQKAHSMCMNSCRIPRFCVHFCR